MTSAAAAVDEPVRRYFAHAFAGSGGAPAAVRLSMRGRIKAGVWLPFTAEQEIRSDGFVWCARVGPGRPGVMRVVDRFEDGAGSTVAHLLGRIRVLHASDADTTRSAAGRAALEAATFAPGALLAGNGLAWEDEGDRTIVASWDLAPERPAVRIITGETGAIRSVSGMRWGKTGKGEFGYVPFGALVHAERRFGDLVLPSAITAGWWFGTERFAPFFETEITAASASSPHRTTPRRATTP